MANSAKAGPSDNSSSLARRTIYVTGFNHKQQTYNQRLLKELFIQGAPVADVKMDDSHARVLLHHEESVPYCLALFDGVELHGEKLELSYRACPTNQVQNYCDHESYFIAQNKHQLSGNLIKPESTGETNLKQHD